MGNIDWIKSLVRYWANIKTVNLLAMDHCHTNMLVQCWTDLIFQHLAHINNNIVCYFARVKEWMAKGEFEFKDKGWADENVRYVPVRSSLLLPSKT